MTTAAEHACHDNLACHDDLVVLTDRLVARLRDTAHRYHLAGVLLGCAAYAYDDCDTIPCTETRQLIREVERR